MEDLSKLSTHQCVLLAAQYASDSNIPALRTLTSLRADDLEFGLILRLLLTFLPETVEPSRYVEYLHELSTNSRDISELDEHPTLDLSTVQELDPKRARKRAKRLHILLQPLVHPLYETSALESSIDPFTHFLINRAHRVDTETGLLELVPQLVVPFLHHSEYLRTWFISTVLPLLRIGYEYYPQQRAPSLEEFAGLKGRRAVELLVRYLRQQKGKREGDAPSAAQILRGAVGPWLCGSEQRRERFSDQTSDLETRRPSIVLDESLQQEPDDWECLFQWLVHTSRADFVLVSRAYLDWDGPDDLDLGGYDEGQVYVDEELQGRLELRYAQCMLASLYTINVSSPETLSTAHELIDRLTNLLSLDPPASLSTDILVLPTYEFDLSTLEGSSRLTLNDETILRSSFPLTQPGETAVRLLEGYTVSAYILSTLLYPLSIKDTAKLHLDGNGSQASTLSRILHSLSSSSKQDGTAWQQTRSKLLWLGHGVLQTISQQNIEIEILKAIVEVGLYQLVVQIYLPAASPPLPISVVEEEVLKAALHAYDNASNGNRARGGMRRASDMIAAFAPSFPQSSRFYRAEALLKATHAMSFYSLILQHGVPLQPVNIRVAEDSLSLLQKLLLQNHGSYTKLDDLISIGQNLVVSQPKTIMDGGEDEGDVSKQAYIKEIAGKKASAERRVICMAIEAALQEDDFETAYSYVVNRLPPTTSTPTSPAGSASSQRFSFGSIPSEAESADEDEDPAWRAALQAGKFRSTPMSSSGTWSGNWGSALSSTAPRFDLRRLEQRMELLSQSLLLAPPSHLEEVLRVWQECEKEMSAVLDQEAKEEERFNDLADRRLPGAFSSESLPVVQPRREVGRGANAEAPMGLFDVARGAAAAFSKSAFPLRGSTGASRGAPAEGRTSMDAGSDAGSAQGEERVRKRDMVASAVTGGLASGIGWMIGATPAQDRERQ